MEMLLNVQNDRTWVTGNEQKRDKCEEDEAAITVNTDHLEHAKKEAVGLDS